MPITRSIIIGFVTAAIIGSLTPLLALSEWNGPINFSVPVIIIASVGLALTAFVAKPQGWRRSFAAGLGFGMPIAALCFLSPSFAPFLDIHIRQLRLTGLVILVLSSFVMIIRGAEDNEKW